MSIWCSLDCKCLHLNAHVNRWLIRMQWTAIVYGVLMLGSSVCSVFGNCVLLLVVLLNRNLQTDTWALTLSFCLSDLALGISIIPFGIHNSLFLVQGYTSNSALCQGSAFLFLLFQIASIHSLTWATVEKFTEICFALSHTGIFTAHRAKVILAVVWMYSLLNATLPLLGFGSYGYSKTKFLCVPRFQPSSIGFNMLFMGLGIIVPILLMCSMYGYIVYIARNQVRRGTFVCNEDHCFYVPANNYFKSSIVMVTTIVCLLVCWLPYIVICFYETLTGKESLQPASAVATWLVLFTSALNPWINTMTQT
ncbi:LOW QUALITY PROTEIN: adenosine receptor A3 [Xyrauchen texanus]|uniref:LOW QUALITY PROTEIN: adenosine receptor A3 n=1 Tax=Xyrauchen texanus TaxID=154827 RepID=UPI0022419AAA|nr:LOW QUALITY PROTEIN: adenosine receptor A3 [Xyrauchen texanus]